MADGWENGVIVDRSDEPCGVVYFVNTPRGVCVMFPRAHEGSLGVKVGQYVRVLIGLPRSLDATNLEVERFIEGRQPEDHSMELKYRKAFIRCNVRFVKTDNGWVVFKNLYLGLVATRESVEYLAKNVRSGCEYRVSCRRTHSDENVAASASIGSPVVWIMEDIDYAARTELQGRWFEGVIVRAADNFVIATSSEVPGDVFIYDWKKRTSDSLESMLGRWVRFQIARRRPHDHGLRLTAEDNYGEIGGEMETRVKKGLPEVRVLCGWWGQMEDGRAFLHSEMGPIRDNAGIIGTSGEYRVWIVKHHRANHSAMWKLSIYNDDLEKIEPEKRGGGDREWRKESGRILQIVEEFLMDERVFAALAASKSESVKRLLHKLNN